MGKQHSFEHGVDLLPLRPEKMPYHIRGTFVEPGIPELGGPSLITHEESETK